MRYIQHACISNICGYRFIAVKVDFFFVFFCFALTIKFLEIKYLPDLAQADFIFTNNNLGPSKWRY